VKFTFELIILFWKRNQCNIVIMLTDKLYISLVFIMEIHC